MGGIFGGTGPGATPGGLDGQAQVNVFGSFGGVAGSNWDATTGALTIAGSAVTSSKPLLNLSQTWNNAGVNFDGLLLAIAHTAAGGASSLLRLRRDTTDIFTVSPFGTVTAANYTISGVFQASGSGGVFVKTASTGVLGWTPSTNIAVAPDTALSRNAAGVVEVNSGTAGQFRDLRVRSAIQQPPASITPASNGDLVFELTSNTQLNVKVKGSDGTVRSATLTLA